MARKMPGAIDWELQLHDEIIKEAPGPFGPGACLYGSDPGHQIALVTLPERRHRVQTYTWRGLPSTIAFTRFTLGFQVRLERR